MRLGWCQGKREEKAPRSSPLPHLPESPQEAKEQAGEKVSLLLQPARCAWALGPESPTLCDTQGKEDWYQSQSQKTGNPPSSPLGSQEGAPQLRHYVQEDLA